jgi:hypothetical protein
MAISGISTGAGFSPYPYGAFGMRGPSERESSERAAAGETVSANEPRSGERNGEALSEAERREVEELKTTDRKVRQHEQAHMAAGGNLVTSGASYQYTTGPDGQRYAVAGEVGIRILPGRTPEETIRIAARVRAAALAPADPSPQDRRVAAQATRMQMQAAREIAMRSAEPEDGAQASASAPAPASFGAGRNDAGEMTAMQIGTYRMMTEADRPAPSGFSVYA